MKINGKSAKRQEIRSRQRQDEFDGFKVVAFPWKALDVPLMMTSRDDYTVSFL